jgi:hypothetical protein
VPIPKRSEDPVSAINADLTEQSESA